MIRCSGGHFLEKSHAQKMADHEYSILDHDRGRIFQYIGTVITAAAALYTSHLGLITDLVNHFYPSLDSGIPKTLDAAIAFAVLYWIFNHWFWRNWLCRKLFKFHDISGDWKVEATTLGPAENLAPEGKPRPWTANIKINQQWTKIGVRLQTTSSESFSKSAALQDIDGRALLMYSYANTPSVRSRATDGLESHYGYCELKFSDDGKSAEGFYFNNMGRVTHGEMRLTKVE
ncbi:hypothetical protein ABH945_000702 [Paraburkholderia sp. GAS333]|uniref:Cap15 family cyclic dinucleotide receptor domain-containing protein n=1 Tax=Paraburkholderia sp. GAS333 TaxID=3156279 RepID=UPI003D1E5FD6